MEVSVQIRQEQPSDYAEVYRLVKAAFAFSDHSDGTEADYLDALRKKAEFIPELSLVAEHAGQIVGQIVLYKTFISTPDKLLAALVLSPVSVRPDYFRRGVARAMISEAFERARALGYTAVFLCGDPAFYHKFGFMPAFEYGIYHISDKTKSAEWCMALELTPAALKGIQGTVDIV